MNKAERFGHRLAQAAAKRPRRAKIAGWCIVGALLLLPIAAVWQAIAHDKAYKVVIFLAVGAIFGWRHYKRAKQASAQVD